MQLFRLSTLKKGVLCATRTSQGLPSIVSRAMNSGRTCAVVTRPRNSDLNKIVVLLGWMGANQKKLCKYSSLYEERGCTTVSFLPPASASVIFHERLKELIGGLLDTVQEAMLHSSPQPQLYIHVFSNSGATSWVAMLHNLHAMDSKHKQIRDAICGVVFDSCPEHLTAVPALYQAIVIATKGTSRNPLLTAAAHTVSAVTLASMFGVFFLAAPICGVSPLFRDFWTTIAEDPLRCPQTMIYSTTDPLIDFRSVEEMAAAREAAGVTVTRVRLERGGHVQHLLTDPDKYEAAVESALGTVTPADPT